LMQLKKLCCHKPVPSIYTIIPIFLGKATHDSLIQCSNNNNNNNNNIREIAQVINVSTYKILWCTGLKKTTN
jgi:hypothetical protein